MQGEDIPNFADPEKWQRIKLLRSSSSFQEVSRDQQHTLDSKLSKQLGVDLNTIQHVGQISGLGELRSRGLNIASPARLAANGIDIPGAEAMAGFHNTRYDLERDRLLPPISLQQRVFPWIEDQYGWMAPSDWKAHCERVMQSPTALPGLEGSAGIEMMRRLEAAEESEEAYHDVSKLQLLHLLLWLRRVVLQDAALFKHESFSEWLVRDRIFQSAEFNAFRLNLLATMESEGGGNPGDFDNCGEFQSDQHTTLETNRGPHPIGADYQDEFQLDQPAFMETNPRSNPSEGNDQEGPLVAYTPGSDAISDFASPALAPRSPNLNHCQPELLARATPVVQRHTQSEQLQHHIQNLQQRVDQQEQEQQRQEQHLKEQTALVKSLLCQQDSMEGTVRVLQTQIHTIQTELTGRKDAQFNTMTEMLQGVASVPLSSDLNTGVGHSPVRESSTSNILSLLFAANERTVSNAFAITQDVSEAVRHGTARKGLGLEPSPLEGGNKIET